MTLSLSLKNEKILSLFAGVRKCLAHTSEREGEKFWTCRFVVDPPPPPSPEFGVATRWYTVACIVVKPGSR